eukprot:508866_1
MSQSNENTNDNTDVIVNNKKKSLFTQSNKNNIPEYAQHYNGTTGRWNCTQCTSNFAQRSTLRNHMIDKHSIHIAKLKPGRPKDSNLVNHTNAAHRDNSNDTKCPFCKKIYSSVYYLKKHTKKSHNYDMNKNSTNNNNNNDDQDIHMDDNTSSNPSSGSSSYSIENSQQSQTMSDDISETEDNHQTTKTVFKCNGCNQTLPSGLDLLAHVAAECNSKN